MSGNACGKALTSRRPIYRIFPCRRCSRRRHSLTIRWPTSGQGSRFKAVDWSLMRPEDLAAQIWLPGTRFFSYLALMKTIPSRIFLLLIASGIPLLVTSLFRQRRLRYLELLFMLSTIVLIGEITLSAVVFVFRMKEPILCQPLIYLAAGLALALIAELIAPNATGFRGSRRLR